MADHVVQLVLSLQSQRVGGLVCVDDDLHVHERWSVRRRLRSRATEGSPELYLVFRVGVHRSDLQEVEGDLHLPTAQSKFSARFHAKDRRDDF